MVCPFEKVSGSTFAWWLVVALALQVACVNGSSAILSGPAADATPAGPSRPATTAEAATADRTTVLRIPEPVPDIIPLPRTVRAEITQGYRSYAGRSGGDRLRSRPTPRIAERSRQGPAALRPGSGLRVVRFEVR